MITRTARHSYRAYATAEQEQWLTGALGATRVIYNDYLWQKEQLYQTGSKAKPRDLTKLSQLPEDYTWLKLLMFSSITYPSMVFFSSVYLVSN